MIIHGGMYIFVITSVNVRFRILAQMKCLKVILKISSNISTILDIFIDARVVYNTRILFCWRWWQKIGGLKMVVFLSIYGDQINWAKAHQFIVPYSTLTSHLLERIKIQLCVHRIVLNIRLTNKTKKLWQIKAICLFVLLYDRSNFCCYCFSAAWATGFRDFHSGHDQ